LGGLFVDEDKNNVYGEPSQYPSDNVFYFDVALVLFAFEGQFLKQSVESVNRADASSAFPFLITVVYHRPTKCAIVLTKHHIITSIRRDGLHL